MKATLKSQIVNFLPFDTNAFVAIFQDLQGGQSTYLRLQIWLYDDP